jgi:hypothetical protein
MTHQQLIDRFETDIVPDNSFHHADHVRLAFAYLSEHPPLQALDKFSTALKRYAAARGKAELYNENYQCRRRVGFRKPRLLSEKASQSEGSQAHGAPSEKAELCCVTTTSSD